MITIGRPYVYEDEEYAFLKAPITISDNTAAAFKSLEGRFLHVHWRFYENYPPVEWKQEGSGLWFAVPKAYGKYLCADRGDAFVTAMIWYAMVTGSDIKCEAPVSKRMAFSINQYLIPALMKEEKGYVHRIKLECPTTDTPYPNADAVGTGMSCGVDSLYTLKLFNQYTVPEGYRLTHLTYLNMGAIFHPDRDNDKEYSIKEFYDTTDRMSEEKRQNAQQVADASGLELLYVKSNLDVDYYRGGYGDTGVYRNFACILAVGGLFKTYYSSSRGRPESFNLDLDKASEHYESLLCDVFTTEGLQFLLSDYDSRLEKMIALQSDKIAQKYLDVCFRFSNCGTCSKCLRTLVILDILGRVDDFSEVFDVARFKRNRTDAYVWLLKTLRKDSLDDDALHAHVIYDYMKKHNKEIPPAAKRKFMLLRITKPARIVRNQIRNLIRHAQ
ncbi:MAG: hypothetical protein IKG81_08725 [Bacteroidales bacterium]|nr:hypothetical protein [Bacteroidales bacterium]